MTYVSLWTCPTDRQHCSGERQLLPEPLTQGLVPHDTQHVSLAAPVASRTADTYAWKRGFGDTPLSIDDNNATDLPQRPRAWGYRRPAEWEPHQATWLAWPHNERTWPGKFHVIPPIFADLVRLVARYEPVRLLAGGKALGMARHLVGDVAGVEIWDVPTNDAWCRDHGPMFVKAPGQPPALVDWRYNAWGGKYPPYDLDDAVPAEIARRGGYRRFAADMVLEGGAVDFNGSGTLMTTRSCLLHPGRNPGWCENRITRYLADFTGASHILWLTGGDFAGDDTDGHIDQLARFVGRNQVVASWCEDPHDPNYATLQQLHRELAEAVDEHGNRLDIIRLPLPEPKYYSGRRLPASYCNFYFVNGAVIVPAFHDPKDEMAKAIFQDLFPDRQIELFPCLDLVWGLGAVHCLAQDEPQWDGDEPELHQRHH